MSDDADSPLQRLTLTVNGTNHLIACEERELLLDVIRERLRLKGTHAGCRNGDCGACTVRIGEDIFKSCLVLAATVDGAEITTVEGLAENGELSPLQDAFWEHDGFQCGFCLPGQLFAADDLLRDIAEPDEAQIRRAMQGNLCRCTGYQKTVDAVKLAARRGRTD